MVHAPPLRKLGQATATQHHTPHTPHRTCKWATPNASLAPGRQVVRALASAAQSGHRRCATKHHTRHHYPYRHTPPTGRRPGGHPRPRFPLFGRRFVHASQPVRTSAAWPGHRRLPANTNAPPPSLTDRHPPSTGRWLGGPASTGHPFPRLDTQHTQHAPGRNRESPAPVSSCGPNTHTCHHSRKSTPRPTTAATHRPP